MKRLGLLSIFVLTQLHIVGLLGCSIAAERGKKYYTHTGVAEQLFTEFFCHIFSSPLEHFSNLDTDKINTT